MEGENSVLSQRDPAKRSFLEVAQEWAGLASTISAFEFVCAGLIADRDGSARAVDEWRSDTRRQMTGLQDGLHRIERHICDLRGGVDALHEQSDREDVHSRQLANLTEQHFESHVLEPVIRRLFPIVDLIDSVDAEKRASGDYPQILDAVLAQVLDLLAVYGVEPIEISASDPFVARTMRAGGMLPAPSPSATGTVATTLRRGFSKGERVFRSPVVAVYGEPEVISNKENHNDHDRPGCGHLRPEDGDRD